MSISGIIDIIFVAVLIILAVIGLTKGFLKSAISMVGSLASMVIAYFAASPLGSLIDKIFKSTSFFANKISNWLYSLSDFFSITRNGESFSNIAGEMSASGVDSAVQRLAKAVLGSGIIPEGESVGSVMGKSLGGLLTTVIGGIVAFILIRIIIKVLEHLSSKITQVRIFGAVDKVLGFVFGLVKGLLYIGVAFVLMSILSYIKPIDNKITPIMDQTKIAQKYYDWVDYRTQDFLNEKFFKKEQTTTPDSSEPEVSATQIDISEISNILGEINRAYLDAENSKIYLFVGSEEITSTENINTKAKYFVQYTSQEELETILSTIDAYKDVEGGHEIIVDNRQTENPQPVVIQQVEIDFLTDENLATIKFVYIDWDNSKAYLKTGETPIDLENLQGDCQYYIDFIGIEDGGNSIKNIIQTYNQNNGNTITLT